MNARLHNKTIIAADVFYFVMNMQFDNIVKFIAPDSN